METHALALGALPSELQACDGMPADAGPVMVIMIIDDQQARRLQACRGPSGDRDDDFVSGGGDVLSAGQEQGSTCMSVAVCVSVTVQAKVPPYPQSPSKSSNLDPCRPTRQTTTATPRPPGPPPPLASPPPSHLPFPFPLRPSHPRSIIGWSPSDRNGWRDTRSTWEGMRAVEAKHTPLGSALSACPTPCAQVPWLHPAYYYTV